MNVVNLLGTVGIWINNIPVIEEYTHRFFRWLRGENQGDLDRRIAGQDRRIAAQGQHIEQLVIVVHRVLNQ
jgi:hypothetical protein